MALALLEYEKTIIHRQKIHISCFKDDIGPKNDMFMTFTLLKNDPPNLQSVRLFFGQDRNLRSKS